MVLSFLVDKQIITRVDKEKVVRDSMNYLRAQFQFSPDWTGQKTAVFKSKSGAYNVLIDDDGSCLVPWEVLVDEVVEVSAFCGALITANVVKIITIASGYEIGEEGREPTPDVFTQIMERLSEIEQAEINPEEVEQIIADYLTENNYVTDTDLNTAIADFVTESDVESIVAAYVDAHKSEWQGSEVSVTAVQQTGTKIAEIDIDGTTTDLYAPNGGASSLSDLTDTAITNPQSGDVLVYDGEKWGNENIANTHERKFEKFCDNMDIDYEYDSATGANYSVIRIYRDKLDGTKQFPFVYEPFSTAKESTYDISVADGWFLAINGGIFDTTTGAPDGIVVENGIVIQNSESTTLSQCRPLVIDGNGDMSEAAYDANANTLVQNGAVSVVCGFMAIIKDYEAVPQSEWNSVSHYTQNAQRQIIGQFGNGDYAIVTCEGRNYQHSDGWTIAEAQAVCQKLGLKFAYNLDGGGSTETMIGLKHFNTIYENTTGRKVPTFIVFNGSNTFVKPERPVITPTLNKAVRIGLNFRSGVASWSANGSRCSIWSADETDFVAPCDDSSSTDVYYILEVPSNAKSAKITVPTPLAVVGPAFYDTNKARVNNPGWLDASSGLELPIISTYKYMSVNIKKSDDSKFDVNTDTTGWKVEFAT